MDVAYLVFILMMTYSVYLANKEDTELSIGPKLLSGFTNS